MKRAALLFGPAALAPASAQVLPATLDARVVNWPVLLLTVAVPLLGFAIVIAILFRLADRLRALATPDPRLGELTEAVARLERRLSPPAPPPPDTTDLRAALALLEPEATPPRSASAGDLARRILAAAERRAAEPAPPAPPPVSEPEPAPAEADSPAPDEDALVDRLLSDPPPSAATLVRTLQTIRELPNSLLTAIASGDVHHRVAERQAELDQALYSRATAETLRAEFGERLSAEDADRLAAWLLERQQTAVRELAAAGLKRIPASPGSLFEEGRILPDPTQPAVPTHRPELAQRVAGVTPGQGGYEYQGTVICPTRAQTYEHDSSGGERGSAR